MKGPGLTDKDREFIQGYTAQGTLLLMLAASLPIVETVSGEERRQIDFLKVWNASLQNVLPRLSVEERHKLQQYDRAFRALLRDPMLTNDLLNPTRE